MLQIEKLYLLVSNLSSIIDKFSKVKVLVVGDVMLDRYWWGSVERISPEAPVPVVKLQKSSLVVGGAANVAANIAGLGAKPYLVGAIGNDNEANLFKPLLKTQKINSDYLIKFDNRQTTLKTRVVAHNQHVVRIDQEDTESLNPEQEEILWNIVETSIDKVDIIVVSDYAKGVVTETVVSRLITKASLLGKLVLVDPKGKDYSKYKNASLITPNKLEAAQACNFQPDGQKGVEQAGKILLEKFSFQAVLITQGENGMTLFLPNEKPFHHSALARKVYDVTGAGDTVIASLAVSLGSGTNLTKASEIANISAGIVVEEIGTTIITSKKLKNFLGN